jgi:hypothetical protein
MQNPGAFMFGHAGGVFGQRLLAPGPGRVAVGKIVGPHQLVDIHMVAKRKSGPVVLKRHVDVFLEIHARQLFQFVAFHPVTVALIGVVQAVHIVRRPARIGFDADQFQFRVALEDAAENEGSDDVLVAPDDRQKGVDLRPPIVLQGALARGEDVEGKR